MKIKGESTVYHCMSKVVGGQLLLGHREKEVLRKQMWEVSRFCGVEILTYCLMNNHFHILLRTPDKAAIHDLEDGDLIERAGSIYSVEKVEALEEMLSSEDETIQRNCRAALKRRMGDVSQFMKELKQRFSIWYNRTREEPRWGTLWAERFKSVLVEDHSFALMTVAAYIDLNPVRAGLAEDPEKYRFCGYGEAMGGSSKAREALVSMVAPREGWSAAIRRYRTIVFGKGSVAGSRKEGQSLDSQRVRSIMNGGGKVQLAEALRCRVRYFSDGAVLGSREFVQQYFKTHRSAFGPRRRDGPRPLMGANWNGLTCIRDLRSEIFL